MPRLSQPRPPAEPTTDDQRDRVERILRAAVEHGSAKGLERMQMADVARDAGVAIATLYRYFPSKTALFVGVMRARVEALGTEVVAPPGLEPWDAVSHLLVRAGRGLMERPRLARAMMTSNSAAVIESGSAAVLDVFQDLILCQAGITDPNPAQKRLVRLVEQAWYGIITSALNGHISAKQAEEDTRLACQLLLSDVLNA